MRKQRRLDRNDNPGNIKFREIGDLVSSLSAYVDSGFVRVHKFEGLNELFDEIKLHLNMLSLGKIRFNEINRYQKSYYKQLGSLLLNVKYTLIHIISVMELQSDEERRSANIENTNREEKLDEARFLLAKLSGYRSRDKRKKQFPGLIQQLSVLAPMIFDQDEQ